MKESDVTPLSGDTRGEDCREHESRRAIDCGGAAGAWPARAAQSESSDRAPAGNKAPHGAGAYPEQHQSI